VPIVRRLDLGLFTRDDYQRLLLNLRRKVVEGSRWISRCASSSIATTPIFVQSYCVMPMMSTATTRFWNGLRGNRRQPQTIREQPRNIGSEALNAFLMHRAGEPNPWDFWAMWIIEGLDKNGFQLGGSR